MLLASSLSAECGPVRHISGNFAFDLAGIPDDRPDTWGTAEADYRTLTFTAPPAGSRVRILRIVGDLTAFWVKNHDVTGFTGVLAAIHRPDSSGSAYADWAADKHFVYVQATIGATGEARASFDQTFDRSDPDALLEDNPRLVFKFAKYLDTTGYWTHAEITFSQIDFCYEHKQN
jgi:hypothetical protein